MIMIVILGITVMVALSAILFLSLRKKKKEKKNKSVKFNLTPQSNPINLLDKYNVKYINPTEFKVGMVEMKKYRSADLCNDTVLYPINGLGPEYGSKMHNNCPLLQFSQEI